MEPLNKVTKESILEEEVFTELFDQEDEIYKAKLMISLEERAQELGVKSKFTKLLNAYKRVERESRKSRSRVSSLIEYWNHGHCSLLPPDSSGGADEEPGDRGRAY